LSWKDARVFLLFLIALGLFCGAGWIFLNKGLYLLPDKMCEGALKRDAVKQMLPRARSADTRSRSHGTGDRLNFWCDVTTSNDSILSGEAQVEPLSSKRWLEYYRAPGGQTRIVHVSVGNIEALAQIDSDSNRSSVYVPCAPPDVPPGNASQSYAVVGEAYIDGRAEAEGAPRRQALTDFVYQLTKHAYKLAECKAPVDFPRELPRYRDSG